MTTAQAEPQAPARWWTFGPRQVAVLGVTLGLLAFWLALPPVVARSGIWPLVVGICAIAAGIWAVTRGVGKLAWGAIVVGALGIVFGLLATRASQGNLHHVVAWGPLLGDMFL